MNQSPCKTSLPHLQGHPGDVRQDAIGVLERPAHLQIQALHVMNHVCALHATHAAHHAVEMQAFHLHRKQRPWPCFMHCTRP